MRKPTAPHIVYAAEMVFQLNCIGIKDVTVAMIGTPEKAHEYDDVCIEAFYRELDIVAGGKGDAGMDSLMNKYRSWTGPVSVVFNSKYLAEHDTDFIGNTLSRLKGTAVVAIDQYGYVDACRRLLDIGQEETFSFRCPKALVEEIVKTNQSVTKLYVESF